MKTVPVSQINSVQNKKIGGTNQFVDMYLVYQFLKRITTPFEKWPAYHLGFIDKNGKVLKQRSTLTSADERRAWGYFDIVTANLKKILAKLPGGSTRIASMAAAYFLFKEHKNIDCTNEKVLAEHLIKNWKTITEEVAANNVGGGAIQMRNDIPLGKPAVDDPTARKRKKTIVSILRRKKVV